MKQGILMKNLVVFLYIDALNPSFLDSNTMPFLSRLGRKHYYSMLDNVLGYSFAIQSCMLSGNYPDRTNHWLPYFHAPEKSPLLFRAFKKIGSVLPIDRLPSLRHLTVGQTRRLVLKDGVRVNNVPFHIIDKLALYSYYFMYELPYFYELEELLDKECQTALTYIGPPTIRRHLYKALLKHVRAASHEKEFIIAYDDALDGLGHKFGPYSTECFNYASSLDRLLFELHEKLKKCFGKRFAFFVFSDHGQCEQTNCVDILSNLDREALNLGDDYICFIDATMALFWVENTRVEEKILEVLGKIKMGKTIDGHLQKRYHLEFNDRRYGDIIFLLKPGGTFFPNFFSPFGTMKGLHGYLPEDDVQKGFLVSNKRFSYNFRHVRDFRNFALNISSNEA